MDNKVIKVGIMGFAHIGRYIYSKLIHNSNFEINAICEIGDSKIFIKK